MSIERAVGNIYLRDNKGGAGSHVRTHTHNHDHATFFFKDWWLVRAADTSGKEFVAQFCSPEYAELRSMYAQHAPEKLTRPVRFPDITGGGPPQFVVTFIGPNDSVPANGEEIIFAPIGHALLVTAEAPHELLCLGNDGYAGCVYAHRTPQGDIVQQFTGWPDSYV